MSKKKKTLKQQQADLFRIVNSIILIMLAVIGAFRLGWIGQNIDSILRVFLGQYPPAFYALMIIFSIHWMFNESQLKKIKKRVWIGLTLLLIAYLLILSFPTDKTLVGTAVFNHYTALFKDIYQFRDAPAYGGLVGAILYALTSYLIDRVGVMILIGVLIVLGLIFIFTPQRIQLFFKRLFEGVHKGANTVSKAGKKLIPAKEESVAEDRVPDPIDHAGLDAQFLTLDSDEETTSKSLFMDWNTEEPIDVRPMSEREIVHEIKEEVKVTDVSTQPIQKTFNIHEKDFYKNYRLPPVSILDGNAKGSKSNQNTSSAKEKGRRLIEVLTQFGIDAELINIHIGPAVTKFELKPDSNVKISRISSIQDNIMMELAVKSLRIEAPIPGKAAVGIEIPNVEMLPVKMREIVSKIPKFYSDESIFVALGKNLLGEPIAIEINRMPHLLVAGATGSGKSVCMNSIITSILLSKKPDELKLLLIDPKKVEFTAYADIPHLIGPIVTDPSEASLALKNIVKMMEERYDTFSKSGVRNITAYNQKVKEFEEDGIEPLPWIVVIIDELADLMAVVGKEVETSIQRITQLARAAGIHLIVATQRPSVDVITGVIKANIPSRIAFAVSSSVDSRTILDTVGAEKLLGYGDMLFIPMGEPNPTRVQGTYVSDDEVANITKYVSEQARPRYDDTFVNLLTTHEGGSGVSAHDDPLYQDAIDIVITHQKASTSFLQRQLKVGYNRAANLIDTLEENGIVSGAMGSKPRIVNYRTREELDEQTPS